MAAFETLAGVTKIRRGYYEVNAVVDVGAGIDNMIDSVIRIKAGQLRWRAGCTTTFTRCTFIEQDLADRYGTQNWYVGTSRFEGTGCSPIFKGCEWIIEREIGANPLNATDAALFAAKPQSPGTGSGFDVGTLASPQFLFDENGQPTRLTIYNDGTDGTEAGPSSWQTANFIAGPGTIINGFIIDIKGRSSGAMTFGVTHPQVASMKLKDNTLLYLSDIHMSAPTLNWPAWQQQTISGLSARNIGIGSDAVAAFAVAWNGSKFCAVGYSASKVTTSPVTPDGISTSPDGITWTIQSGLAGTAWGTSGIINDITWDDTKFCIVGTSGKVATSPDGVTWTYQPGLASTAWGTSVAYAVVWTGSQFCVVGTSGKAATSPDGVTWTNRTGLASTTWGTSTSYAISWSGTQFCVVGEQGKVATSPDGITWTYRPGLSSTTWGTSVARDITWDGTQFCVVGEEGKVATSPDGITWTYRAGLSSTNWGAYAAALSITWTGTQFCVAGYGGRVATSPDGITWTYRAGLSGTTWANDEVYDIAWTGSQFCAVGSSGKAATSPDGITWTYRSGLSSSGWGTAVASYGQPNSYVRLLNPVGEIGKVESIGINTYHNYGKLVIERTAKFQFLDANGNTLDKTRVITVNRKTSAVKADVYSSSSTGYSIDLMHWYQDYNNITKTYDNQYKFYIRAYGYTPQVKTLDVGTTTDPYYNFTTTLLFADPYITQTNANTVAAYTTLNDANMVYDYIKYHAYAKTTTLAEFDKTFVTYNNSRLDFGDLNVKIDPTLNVVSYLNSALSSTTLTWTPPVSQNTITKLLTLQENTYSSYTFSDITAGTIGDITLSSDGLTVWVSVFGASGAAKIYKYTLATAHDLTSKTLASTHTFPLPNTTSVSANWTTITNGNAFTFTWAPDGLSLIIPVAGVQWMICCVCSTPFDLTTTTSASLNWGGYGTADIPQTTSAPKITLTTNTTRGNAAIFHDQRTMEIAAGSQTLNRWRVMTVTYPFNGSSFASTSYMNSQTNCSIQAMQFIDGSFYYVANDTPNLTAWAYGGTKGRLMRLDDGDPVDIALGNPADWANSVITNVSYTSSSSSTTQALYFARSVPIKFGFEHATVFKNAVTGRINTWLTDSTTNTVWAYDVPALETPGYYSGGDANTFYLKSSAIASTGTFDGLVTTGYFTLTNGATTGLTIQDANGVAASIEVTSVLPGSRIQLYNVTQANELANTIVGGTSYSYSYTSGAPGALVAAGDVIRVRATYCVGLTAMNEFETFFIVGDFGGGTFLNQTEDLVYKANLIDGSTVTEYAADIDNIQIDLSDGDGLTTIQRAWAWYCYNMMSESGINHFFGGLIAEDILNYKVITAKVPLTIQNTGTNSVLISGGRIYRDDGQPIFAPGSGPIQNEYGRAYAIEVSTAAGLSTEQFNALSNSINTVDTNLNTINEGVKKASKLIPYNGNLI